MEVLPADILDCSPSLASGIPRFVEVVYRIFGCELVQEAGVLLRTCDRHRRPPTRAAVALRAAPRRPQVVTATGQALLQRFYYRRSLSEFDVFEGARRSVRRRRRLLSRRAHPACQSRWLARCLRAR